MSKGTSDSKDYKGSDCIKDYPKEVSLERATAFINFDGHIVECTTEFAEIVERSQSALLGADITSLCKYDSPNSLLEAKYNLDQLTSASEGQSWQAILNTNSDTIYDVRVMSGVMRIGGKKVLEARIVPNEVRRDSMRRMSKLVSRPDMLLQPAPAKEDHPSVLSVLVVEDSPTSLKMMAKMIQRLGHSVKTAVNGVDALELLRDQSFDIVLMDINMPLMNGLEASHEFRKLERESSKGKVRKHQKIIAMSADINNTIFHEVTNAGFDAFIPKPLTEERFLEVVALPINPSSK